MTRALVSLITLAVAACGGDDSGGPTAIDAARLVDGASGGDGDPGARVCEASPPLPEQPTTGGAVLGAWTLTWTCVQGCVGNRPGLTYASRVEVGDDALAYSSPTCPRCTLTHAASAGLDRCMEVGGGTDWDVQCRFAYQVCERSGGLEGVVTWKEPGLSEQTWRMNGVR